MCSRWGSEVWSWKRLSSAPRKATDACVYVHTHYTQPQGRIECRKLLTKPPRLDTVSPERERAVEETDVHVQAHADELDELTPGLNSRLGWGLQTRCKTQKRSKRNMLPIRKRCKNEHSANTERLQGRNAANSRNKQQNLANRGTKVRDGPILWDQSPFKLRAECISSALVEVEEVG